MNQEQQLTGNYQILNLFQIFKYSEIINGMQVILHLLLIKQLIHISLLKHIGILVMQRHIKQPNLIQSYQTFLIKINPQFDWGFFYLINNYYICFMKIDLRDCKPGDILISSQGSKLEYVAPTPYKHFSYLDHVVRYIEDENGNSMGKENYGTRTHDGYTFAMNRIPETDHDIVQIIKQ